MRATHADRRENDHRPFTRRTTVRIDGFSTSRLNELALAAICVLVAGCDNTPPGTIPCATECEGTFHLAGISEASNLLIRQNGTCHWNHNSCDTTPRVSGRIEEEGGRMFFVPDNANEYSFPTSISASGTQLIFSEVERVELRMSAQGQLITVTRSGALRWDSGRNCTICASYGSHGTGILPCACIDGPGGMATDDVPKCDEDVEDANDEPQPLLRGTYHIPGLVIATNLLLREDDTYVWDSNSCDHTPNGLGAIEEREDGVLLLRPSQAVYPDFPVRVLGRGFESDAVEEVELSIAADGSIITRVDDDSIRWAVGRMCTICEGVGSDEHAAGLESCACIGGPGAVSISDVPNCDE